MKAIPQKSNNSHSVLAIGNSIEAVVGFFAVGAGIVSILTFGLTPSLIATTVYTAVVAGIAMLSAYHLYVG